MRGGKGPLGTESIWSCCKLNLYANCFLHLALHISVVLQTKPLCLLLPKPHITQSITSESPFGQKIKVQVLAGVLYARWPAAKSSSLSPHTLVP